MNLAEPVSLPVTPIRVPLDVYAQLPAELAVSDRVSPWTQQNWGVDRMPWFIEGPVLNENGDLYLVDIAWGRILRVDRQGNFDVVAEYDGEPNGLALSPEGRLFIADHRNGLMVLDDPARSSEVTPILEGFGSEPFKGLNDLVFGPHAELYFTDQGGTGLHDPTGRVFRLETDGRLRTILDNVPSPNGIAVDGKGTTVFVAVTRDNAVWRAPLRVDGTVTKAGRFVQLSGGTGPDGLLLAADGSLFVAHLGLGIVWMFGPRGIPICYLQAPQGVATTNVTMAREGSRVFVTESVTGCVLTADLTEHLPALSSTQQQLD